MTAMVWRPAAKRLEIIAELGNARVLPWRRRKSFGSPRLSLADQVEPPYVPTTAGAPVCKTHPGTIDDRSSMVDVE
jgi:hypothetical protein